MDWVREGDARKTGREEGGGEGEMRSAVNELTRPDEASLDHFCHLCPTLPSPALLSKRAQFNSIEAVSN